MTLSFLMILIYNSLLQWISHAFLSFFLSLGTFQNVLFDVFRDSSFLFMLNSLCDWFSPNLLLIYIVNVWKIKWCLTLDQWIDWSVNTAFVFFPSNISKKAKVNRQHYKVLSVVACTRYCETRMAETHNM